MLTTDDKAQAMRERIKAAFVIPSVNLAWRFTSGKYTGKTIKQVMDENINYVAHLVEDEAIELTARAYMYYVDAVQEENDRQLDMMYTEIELDEYGDR